LIQINSISLAFGEKTIFDRMNWFITEKSRIGLVGDNGQGKTTLLRAIMGMVDLDEGSIDIPNKKTYHLFRGIGFCISVTLNRMGFRAHELMGS